MIRLYCSSLFHVRGRRKDPVPREGPVIVVANHISPIDPLLLIATIRERLPAFLVAKEYAVLPIVRYFLGLAKCIPVDRARPDMSTTRGALRMLRAGHIVGIFIEGGIAPPGSAYTPKPGAVALAIRTKATLVPARIDGAPYHDFILWPFFTPSRTTVKYGPPIDLSHVDPNGITREKLADLTEMVMNRIRALAHNPREIDR
jgi:1-acyl-sn-glycerol-3-phosphate acyltransferase